MGLLLTLPMTNELWLQINGLDENAIPHRWVLGSHGYGCHCPDCLSLEGEVRTLDEWQNSVMPGSSRLQCGGRCRCHLEPTLNLPTRFVIQLPLEANAALFRKMMYKDGLRRWRVDYTEDRLVPRPGARLPARCPAASLPRSAASDRHLWWEAPKKNTRPFHKPVHGVD